MPRNISIIFAGLFLLLSLLLLSWPAEETKTVSRKPIASIDLLQSENKNPQLITQDGKLTRSWAALLFAAQMNGWSGSLNGDISGVRSYGEQKKLHQLFLQGLGPPAFHPDGPSRHILSNIRKKGQWSQAVDVSKPKELIRVSKTLGVDLYQPYPDEPWHVEARGPFQLSGFFPGVIASAPEVRQPLASLEILLLLLCLLAFFRFAFLFEATAKEERILLPVAQLLLLLALPLTFYNLLSLSNALSFITLLLSAVAFAALLLIPRR